MFVNEELRSEHSLKQQSPVMLIFNYNPLHIQAPQIQDAIKLHSHITTMEVVEDDIKASNILGL